MTDRPLAELIIEADQQWGRMGLVERERHGAPTRDWKAISPVVAQYIANYVESSRAAPKGHEYTPDSKGEQGFGPRCPSTHYWTGMQCQHQAGHPGCCVADPTEHGEWITDGQRHVLLWWHAEPACNQRPADGADFAPVERTPVPGPRTPPDLERKP